MTLAEKYARMDVRTNADTPHDALVARKFGAKRESVCVVPSICSSKKIRLSLMREMILAKDEEGRRKGT